MAKERLKHDFTYALPDIRKHSDLKLFSQLGFAGVYAIGPEGGPIKVGWTQNPSTRFNSLQNDHWRELKVHEITWTLGRHFAVRLEGEIQSILKKAGRHLRGGWFDVPLNLMMGAFQVATDRSGVETFTNAELMERFERERDRVSRSIVHRIGAEALVA
jgi:hypothetical protein